MTVPDRRAKTFHEAARELLTTWCDGLLGLQITDSPWRDLSGGILCPACGRVHGRCADAIYPLMHMAHTTGQDKYLQAAIRLQSWSHKVSKPDGAWVNDIAINPWKGITVFGAIAQAEALRHHGQILPDDVRQQWRDRLHRAGEYVFANFTMETANINYPVTAAYALLLLGTMFNEPTWLTRGREFAHGTMAYFTQHDGLLHGEGSPRNEVSPKGCRPVDLGYNVEESLPSLTLYAKLVGDSDMLDFLTDAWRRHLIFMLPDGAWDCSWSSRNYKWAYWGSRTSDGCQAGLALLADRDPTFIEAARRNLDLYARCTANNLLYGGPHYLAHDESPCVHHTFCHAKTLATLLDHVPHDIPNTPVPLPRQSASGAQHLRDLDLWLIARGPWRATITAYDWPATRPHPHVSGGSLAMLWHQHVGPVLVASLNTQSLSEPHNQQEDRDASYQRLTPRLEMQHDGQAYMSCVDVEARIAVTESDDAITAHTTTRLRTLQGQDLPTPVHCILDYRFEDDRLTIEAAVLESAGNAPGANTAANASAANSVDNITLILPIISPRGQAVTATPSNINIATPQRNDPATPHNNDIALADTTIEVTADLPLAIDPTTPDRIFNLTPGLQAVPVRLQWNPQTHARAKVVIRIAPRHAKR